MDQPQARLQHQAADANTNLSATEAPDSQSWNLQISANARSWKTLRGPDRGARQAAELRTLLEHHDRSSSGVRLNRDGRISREHYAEVLGTSRKHLSEQSLRLVEEWNIALDKRRGGLRPVARQFLEAIEADKLSPYGVTATNYRIIDLPYYSKRLGVSVTCLREALGDGLADLNESLAASGILRKPLEKQFFAQIEADKASPAGIVATARRLIDVPYYASRLGASVSALRNAIGDQLAALNKEFAQKGLLRTPLERRLLSEVQRDIDEFRRPRLGRGGRIHRQHYAELVGVTHQHLGKRCQGLLKSLDQEYGGPSNAEVHLVEMEKWLEGHYQRRELLLREGKLDRKLFGQAFGFDTTSGWMTRYPGIRALFAAFDARAAEENYTPAAFDTEMQRLRAALDNDPELNRDRLSVNRVDLARRLGIVHSRLKRSPFAEVICKHDEIILRRAKQSLINPYVAGRVCVFSDFIDPWGAPFLTQIGVQFRDAFSHARDKNQMTACYVALRALLSFIGGSSLSVCRAVVSSTSSGHPLDQRQWEFAMFAYREHLVGEVQRKALTKGQADHAIAGARRVLARMDPLLPKLETHLPGLKFARAFVAHRASLAEALPKSQPGPAYIEFANNILEQAADRFKVALGQSEAECFTKSLASEMEHSRDLPSDLAHAILLVLDRRLAGIREAASVIMDKARADATEGNALLAYADIDAHAFYREMLATPKRTLERTELVRRWFPNPFGLETQAAEAARRRSIANLLQLAVAEFDGILPTENNRKALGNLGSFFKLRYLELGSRTSLQSLLNPSRDACGAALTLYLIESGANLSVGRTLDADCIEPASQPGFKLITGHKARAKGKPIYAELPSHSPAVRALEWYAEHSARYRAQVGRSEARNLFVFRIGERFQLAPPNWYTDWFKSLAGTVPALQQTDVVPSMIRPSVLLKAALENDGRLQVGRAIGQHGQAVTLGYQLKLPIRFLRDQHMRRFQRQFETRVLQDVVDVARSLGISAEEFERRLQELQATGLGTFCTDPYSRPGTQGQRCQSLDCWRDCPQMLVVANVEAIALLQIWKKSLEDVRGDWERDHPERWGEVWLPWLCLTEVVQKKMSRGRLLLTWKQAEKRAAQLSAQPNFVAPRPF